MVNALALEKLIAPFLRELMPQGGIDINQSHWQRLGRGYGGTGDRPDVRYMRALIEVLYKIAAKTGENQYKKLADTQAGFMANFARETDPTWLWGTVLECIGLHREHNAPDQEMLSRALIIVSWARKRKLNLEINGMTYGHFPCGYGNKETKDCGWTNDLAVFGSGLIRTYELTKDKTILQDAVSYAEFFVQEWRPDGLGPDGYWHTGTWRTDMGSWVVGPLHHKGFESVDLYSDQASWVFSTFPCIDYLMRLYRHNRDPRYVDRCLKAAQWTFDHCQFEDGAIGLCGRDDKWLGATGYSISQVAIINNTIETEAIPAKLFEHAKYSYAYLENSMPHADINEKGVQWVHRQTLTDPLVNVGWMWLNAISGWLDGEKLTSNAGGV